MASTATQTQNQTRAPRGGAPKARGRGGNRGGDRGGRPRNANGKRPEQKSKDQEQESTVSKLQGQQVSTAAAAEAEENENEADVCWICAEPVKYYSVSECNHRTCHVCALRLRALYKKTDCTFCKEPQVNVVFTTSGDALYNTFTLADMPHNDSKLAIYFETQEMMEETLILLRYNCPDSDCDYIATGWNDLKLHVRATHGKLLCELCLRSKKVFAHEHALYTYTQLCTHLPSMDNRRQHKVVPKEQIEGGIHPLCEFCRECFVDEDELYKHMREKHEECFVCKRNEVRDQYFRDYPSLEKHFTSAHHACTQPSCLAHKFVVFNTHLDLQAHMVEEHGADMSARDKKGARRVQAEFEFEEVGIGGRRPRREHERDRDREPPPRPQQQQQQQQPQPQPGPSRPPGGGRRREGFGSSLTPSGGATPTPPNGQQAVATNTPPGPSRRASPSPLPRAGDVDPLVLERHSAFLNRLSALSANPATAVPAVKSAIRSFLSNESSSRDLISTIYNVLERNLEKTAGMVNAFVDLLADGDGTEEEKEERRRGLLKEWRGFEVEERSQFPDLVVPTSLGTGYAGITSGRVLNAKHSTAARSSKQSTRQVWDRVAQAASSSTSGPSRSTQASTSQAPVERFPAISSSSNNVVHKPTKATQPSGPAFRQPVRSTPWASAAGASSSSPAGGAPVSSYNPAFSSNPLPSSQAMKPHSTAGGGGGGGGARAPPPPILSQKLFPTLVSTNAPRERPVINGNASLRNILGGKAPPPVGAVWNGSAPAGNGDGDAGGGDAAAADAEAPAPAVGGGKGKKRKGKQKQTLFTTSFTPI